MAGVDICRLCGVPRFISTALEWGDNGVISLPSAPGERMVFYEAETIDALFSGIKELIDMPIDNMVIESRRRETRRYMEGVVPASISEQMRSFEVGNPDHIEIGMRYNTQISMIGKLYGYGEITLGDEWKGDNPHPWRMIFIRHPYSLPFFMADTLGTVEAIEGVELWVESEDLGSGLYRVSVREGDHPVEFRERLRRKRYAFKPGDISFRRCQACGIPLDVGRCHWDTDKGTIADPATGKRMVFFGSAAMDAILDDLQAELGDSIPEVAIEAQRRFIRSYLSGNKWRRRGHDTRLVNAMYGLGNMTRFEVGEGRVAMTIENSCMHLPVVGLAQALVEIDLGLDASSRTWELADDGDLNIEIAAL